MLGDMLAIMPEVAEGDSLPSPESLRKKIIVKGKVTRAGEVRNSNCMWRRSCWEEPMVCSTTSIC